MSKDEFKKHIWTFYSENKRSFPWRETEDPYKILVSEIMLQQTQTDRVVPKFISWIYHFPSFKVLSDASLEEVLLKWQGLGYNRRGLNLKRAAEIVTQEFKGKLPDDTQTLKSLPGIGAYTAGAVQAFAWNKPVVFIETNIRTVFIHHFFNDHGQIHDSELLPLIEETLDTINPREWYWALMDYGSHLKRTLPNPSRKSKHHIRQSRFEGSNREVRSKILKYILTHTQVTKEDILKNIISEKWNVEKNIHDLIDEGFITCTDNIYVIAQK